MKTDPFDHVPIVEAWLKEPVWLPPSDIARLTQLVHQTPQPRHWWQRPMTGRSQHMFNALKFVVGGVVVAAVGGFLVSGYLPTQQQDRQPPAAATASPAMETPSPSAGPDESTQTAEPVDPALMASALVLQAGTGETVGGLTQVGRLSTEGYPRFGEIQDLQVIGDQLVARSSIDERNEQSRDVILRSADAMTWLPIAVPGDDPAIRDLITGGEGLIAGGSLAADGKRRAALWSSPDGLAWTEIPAPPTRRVDQLVSVDEDGSVVRSGDQLWATQDGEWSEWNAIPNSSILRGPAGYLTWQGGGQDQAVPTWVLHNAAPFTRATEVSLPDALAWRTAPIGAPDMDVQIFALDDEWVMVGSEVKAPDTIHLSTDGLEWLDAPRPPEMAVTQIRWMAPMGDQVTAFGTVTGANGSSGAIWTWTLGEPAAAPETLSGTGDEWIDAPVPWQGGYVATGYERNRDQAITLWRMESDPAD